MSPWPAALLILWIRFSGASVEVAERVKQPIAEPWVELIGADLADGANGRPELFEVASAAVADLQVLVEPGPRLLIERTVEVGGDEFHQLWQVMLSSLIRRIQVALKDQPNRSPASMQQHPLVGTGDAQHFTYLTGVESEHVP